MLSCTKSPSEHIFRRKDTLKAPSIRQPWAWLIVNGYKDIENRDWTTNFRGRVYVHTGVSKSDMDTQRIFYGQDMPELYCIAHRWRLIKGPYVWYCPVCFPREGEYGD